DVFGRVRIGAGEEAVRVQEREPTTHGGSGGQARFHREKPGSEVSEPGVQARAALLAAEAGEVVVQDVGGSHVRAVVLLADAGQQLARAEPQGRATLMEISPRLQCLLKSPGARERGKVDEVVHTV